MRIAVTLPDELVEQAKSVSGKRRLSDAIASILAEHFAMKNRVALLDKLFRERVPHEYKKIKQERRGRDWSDDERGRSRR
jgi:hypothetical protein